MEKIKHTEHLPLPYIFSRDENLKQWQLHTEIGTLVLTFARQVTEKIDENEFINRTLPTAHFVHKACNHHYLLVEALKAHNDWISKCDFTGMPEKQREEAYKINAQFKSLLSSLEPK